MSSTASPAAVEQRVGFPAKIEAADGDRHGRPVGGCNPVRRPGPVTMEHVLLALRETEEERELRIRGLFGFFDAAGKLYLDYAQIEAGLSAMRIPAEHKYARDLLKVCDADRDGRVDYQEFRQYMDDKELELYRIFQAMDVEHNGCILPEELLDALIKAVETDFQQCSGCLGCCSKTTPIIAVDEPSKGLKIQGKVVKKSNISEDFWSTSPCEMDNSAIQSQRSFSSISTSTQPLDTHTNGAGSSGTPEFVNHGLVLWNQTRQQWIGNRRPENKSEQVKEPRLSWNATYNSLLGTNKPFPQPIPLSEMIDFLIDVWEQEGLYD